jgi:serine/threonine protein phosphatase 1
MARDPSEIFADLGGAVRVWAIAAVHGEAERLRRVHAAISERFARGDRLVYLGNYLGYGGRIPETLDELLAFRRSILTRPGLEPEDIVYLRGAQEEMWQKLLQIQFAVDPDRVLDWMLEQGVEATLRAYGGRAEEAHGCFREGTLAVTRWTGGLRDSLQAHPGHDDLLGTLHRAAYTGEGGLLFVHAGVDPHRPLSEQGDTLWWGSGYFASLDGPYGGFNRVVRGYDRAHDGVQIGDHAATIDGGCGFGGPLVACCFGARGELADRVES